MKKLLYTLAAVLVPSLAMAQTYTENFIKNTTHQVKTTDGEHRAGTTTDLTADEKIETITYFDGLGRPMQSIAKQAGGNRQDIIAPVVYDGFGRQVKDYLPYADPNQTSEANLDYRQQDPSFFTAINTRYLAKFLGDLNAGLPNPFSEKHLEASPLSRVLEQGAPGAAWALNETVDTDPNNDDADHTIKFGYATNTEHDYVRQFGVSFPTGNTEAPQLVDAGYYLASQLYKTTTKDENWRPSQVNFTEHTTEEYKDKLGRVVLKRTFDKQKWLDTYYVYDDYGNLTYVLPPKAVTLNTVPNPYYGDLGFYGDISSMLLTGGGYAEYVIWDTADGFSVAIEITGFTEGTALKSGKIADLDFSPYAPPLIDAVLGNIVSRDSSGNGNIVATVYTKDGDLYLNSTGAGLYTPNGSGNYYETMYADLSNYTANTIGTSTLNGLCYQYRYDNRNRLMEKKIPGKGREYIVYDNLDRPVLTQDANQRKANNTGLTKDQWLFTKYDVFGRVAYTGIFGSDSQRETLQGTFNGKSELQNYESQVPTGTGYLGTYYTNDDFPNADIEILTINYYDDYDFSVYTIPSVLDNGEAVVNHDNADKPKTKGLSTGSKVKVLGTSSWITTVMGYDIKGRPIYVKNVNGYLGTTDIVETHLDFVGKVEETMTTHYKSGNTIKTTGTFTYDHAGRLMSQKQRIGNSADELIVFNKYDELGQLESKKVGGNAATNIESSAGLQTVDYTYNIRGWLKQINDPSTLGNDLFTFKLNYNAPGHGATALYNGNISETEWRTANTDNTLKWYRYNYDALNRLQGGYDNAINFIESIGYDKNGNINNLNRKGLNESNGTYVFIDVLSYTYAADSNQLIGVNDNAFKTYGFKDGNTNGDDYSYDANGNMVKDLNKGIVGANNTDGILYNHLNLPSEVKFGSTNKIKYIYDATGVKLEKQVTEGTNTAKTFYAGNYVYKQDNQNTAVELQFFNHPEGYVDAENGFKYVYQYKDHLGNIRLSYKRDESINPVFIDNNFNSSTDGWSSPGSGSINNTNQKLNISIANKWNSTGKYITITPNVPLHIEFDFENGTMVSPVFYVRENINGIWEPGGDRDQIWDIQDGHHVLDLTLTGQGVMLYFEKGSAPDDGTSTNCFVDNFKLTQNGLEILEENNYYPFGMKHRGYNDVPTAFANPALKFKYNNTEYEEALGLNLYEMDVRSYDPAIARFTSIDPVTHHSQSTYTAFDNNPVYWADPSGADAITFYNDGTEDFADFFNSLKNQGQQSQSGNRIGGDTNHSGNGTSNDTSTCTDCNICPETCNDGGSEIKTEHLGEVWISDKWNSEGEYVSHLAQAEYWRKHFEGFAAEFDAGWNNWDPNGIGNAWMNIAAGGIGGAMLLPLASVTSSGFGMAGVRSAVLDSYYTGLARSTLYYYQFNVGASELLSTTASAAIIGTGKAIGSTYVKLAPRAFMRFMYNNGVHNFFRTPVNFNVDLIAPIVNGLYGSFSGAPYFDRPFPK